MATGSYLSIITLNINELNAPTKRQRLAEWIQKQDPCFEVGLLQTTYAGVLFLYPFSQSLSLVGAFNPFTFKVITDKYDPVAIYFIVLGSNLYTVFVFPVQRISFNICWRAGLVVLNSLSFCLSVKLLISPSYLNEILAGYNNLGCRFFSFIILSMSCHSLLA